MNILSRMEREDIFKNNAIYELGMHATLHKNLGHIKAGINFF